MELCAGRLSRRTGRRQNHTYLQILADGMRGVIRRAHITQTGRRQNQRACNPALGRMKRRRHRSTGCDHAPSWRETSRALEHTLGQQRLMGSRYRSPSAIQPTIDQIRPRAPSRGDARLRSWGGRLQKVDLYPSLHTSSTLPPISFPPPISSSTLLSSHPCPSPLLSVPLPFPRYPRAPHS